MTDTLTMQLPRVGVVVVNFRGTELTLACVRSLMRSTGVALDVIVVDNASCDGTLEELRAGLPLGVKLIESAVNGGYTSGNNLGIADAVRRGVDWIFILNNDTVLEPDCIAKLVAVAQSDPTIALVNPLIYFGEPRAEPVLWFGGGRFNPWFGRATHVGWKQPRSRALPLSDITFCTGCALLVSANALREIGSFDESLFGYAEDLDWSLRARHLKYRMLFVPDAVVWHLEGIAYRRAGGEALRQYLSARNLLRVFARHIRWYQWPSVLATFAVDHLGRFTLLSILRRDSAALRGTWRGVWHAFAGGHSRIEHEADTARRAAGISRNG